MFNAQAIKWGTRLSKQLHAALYLHTGGLSQAFPTSAEQDKAPAIWGIFHSFLGSTLMADPHQDPGRARTGEILEAEV